MNASFQLSLEYIDSQPGCHTFRIAFESSDDRYLLNYPEVTGLRFTSPHGGKVEEFRTGCLRSAPQDEFVLNPLDRIAFDLRACDNIKSNFEQPWTIQLSPGEYQVDYCYSLDVNLRRYDYLNKGSRFADSTKPWSGSVVSNAVHFRVP